MRNSLPEILYKYRSITEYDRDSSSERGFTRRFLAQGEFYFARFSELGDPNEALFSYDENIDIAIQEKELANYEYIKIVDRLSDERIHLLVNGHIGGEYVRKALDKMYGVFSLSYDEKNLLMFDYYADSHRRICVGLEWRKLEIKRKDTGEIQLPSKIEYLRHPPIVSSMHVNSLDNIFTTKWNEYSHEKEWSFFYKPAPIKKRSVIKSIVFGCATPEEDKKLVRSWVKDLNHVIFYQAKLERGKYALELVQID